MGMLTGLMLLLVMMPQEGWGAPAVAMTNAGGSLVLTGTEDTRPRLLAKQPPSSGKLGGEEGREMGGGALIREVQSFIARHRSRAWPEVVYLRPLPAGRRSWPRLSGGEASLAAMIQKYARFYGVEESLVRAVIRHESGGNSRAVSPKGAMGLMQLMPATASLMGVRDPFDPEENLAGGVGYLRRCLERFGYNVPLAVAAYNAGPERVAQYGGVPPFAETQLFVKNVMGSYLGGQSGESLSGRWLPGGTTASGICGRPGWHPLDVKPNGLGVRPKIIEVCFPIRKPRLNQDKKAASGPLQ